MMTVPVAPGRGRLRPLGMSEVRMTGGFWRDLGRVNGRATLGHCLSWMERLGWLGNFRAAADRRGEHAGREFSDSEIYKLAEAIAWESARRPDPWLESTLDKLAAQVGAAQRPDGYLNTAFGGPGQPARYSDLEWGHELYCYGHLIQAGVAAGRSGTGGELLEVATRAADHVCAAFGPYGDDGVCGHPCVEMALVELARLTGEQRYLDQAASFVDRRGNGRLADIHLGRAYYQDDLPVRAARVLRGHAVRALYLAAGAVDVAVETGDDALLAAVVAQWEATVARRTYLTGGMGSRHSGESFGDDFELPSDRAYAETCAGVASVMLSWRLLLATGESRYADLIERTLFNVVATAPAADGRAFFYVNPLHQSVRGTPLPPDWVSPRPATRLRAAWNQVSCCPNNVARMLASLPAYLATADPDGLQIHQFADAEISTTLDGGRPVGLRMRTGYPADGAVTVEVTTAPAGRTTLTLRVPDWAVGRATLTDPDGRSRPATAGTVEVSRAFAAGDTVRLELPVAPRWTVPDPRVDAVRGCLAVERGPVVLCVESVDLPDGTDVDAVRVDTSAAPVDRDGAVVVAGELVAPEPAGWPYHSPGGAGGTGRGTEIVLRPYHSWAQRGPATMRVWLPRADRPGPA